MSSDSRDTAVSTKALLHEINFTLENHDRRLRDYNLDLEISVTLIDKRLRKIDILLEKIITKIQGGENE